MTQTSEMLKEKYGMAAVLGVEQSIVDGVLREGFTCRRDANKQSDDIYRPLHDLIRTALEPRLRYEAELDPSFKQIIPYAILQHVPTGRVYTTLRTGGDSRLIGQASIGLGGHMESGEGFQNCLLRELKEEVGLEPDEIDAITFCGYLYSSASEVDSVHVGMVYRVQTQRDNLRCMEDDKLSGAWLTPSELINLRGEGILESWSRIAYDAVLSRELEPYHEPPRSFMNRR